MTRAVRPSNTTRTTLAGAEPVLVTGGVDTHKDTHTAAAVDGAGRVLGTAQFPATHAGYRALLAWLRRHADDHGQLALVGVEGTGAYGAGLTRHLQDEGVRVVEVDRPDRKTRRFQGKSDPIDAVAAALAALSGRQDGTPKDRTGATESIRLLRVPRRGAVRARAKVMVQIKAVIVTAPEQLRATLTPMADQDLIATLAASRPDRSGVTDPAVAVRVALRQLARQYQYLTEEINDLDALLAPLVAQTAPALLALNGVGTDVAGQLLVTAGANPDRITSEAAFAALCGVAPVPASSGRTSRHRLSRGGDRNANAALYMIVLCRLRWDPGTRTYADRRTREGKTKKEIVRCLKRHVAREVYRALPRHALHDRPVAA
jgi:transposase